MYRRQGRLRRVRRGEGQYGGAKRGAWLVPFRSDIRNRDMTRGPAPRGHRSLNKPCARPLWVREQGRPDCDGARQVNRRGRDRAEPARGPDGRVKGKEKLCRCASAPQLLTRPCPKRITNTVLFRIAPDNVATRMDEMRRWLDARRIPGCIRPSRTSSASRRASTVSRAK